MKWYEAGGIVGGKVPKEMKNLPSQDVVDARLTPGEIVIPLETIHKGIDAIIDFVKDELSKNIHLYKDHFDRGGTEGGGMSNPASLGVVRGMQKAFYGTKKPAVEEQATETQIPPPPPPPPTPPSNTPSQPIWHNNKTYQNAVAEARAAAAASAAAAAGAGGPNASKSEYQSEPTPPSNTPSTKAGFDEGGTVEPSLWESFKKGFAGVNGSSSSAPAPKPTGSNAGSDEGAKKLGQGWSEAGFAEGGTVCMADGGEVNNSISPENALNQYVHGQGIHGGTVFDGSSDEMFLFDKFCFDIDKARMISKKESNAEIPVDHRWIDKIKIDKEEAMDSKSKNPVFIAQVHTPNGIKPLLIDGNHRMYRALQKGKSSIKAYIFTPEQTASLFMPKPPHIEHPKDEGKQKFYDGGTAQPAFDPDKYLAQKTGQASADFDPDKYLSEKTGKAPEKESSVGEKLQTGLENFGNMMTLGYLPHLQAATAPAVNRAMDILGVPKGEDQDSNYVQRRDENIRRIDEESENNPKSALAGKVLGVIGSAVSSPELPIIKGAGVLKNAARGVAYGAGYGAAQNPGDIEGEFDPIQGEQRLSNAKTGAEIGAVTGGVTGAIAKGLGAMKNSADVAQGIANNQAIKASGGMLKDFRQLSANDKIDDVGKFALDNKIVQAGDTADDVAEKAHDFRQDAGKRLDEVYSEAQKQIGDKNSANQRGFSPSEDKAEILDKIDQKLGDDPKKAAALNQIETYLDSLHEKYGDGILDPKTANNIKTKVDQTAINYQRNPLAKDPAAEQAFSVLRDHINDAVKNHVEDIGKASGSPELGQKLVQANKDYGMARQLQGMAEDRVARENANRAVSLTDTIAGVGGATSGAILGEEMGGHPVEGAGLGLLAGVANNIGRKYGPGIIAATANRAAPILEKTVVPVGELGSKIPSAILEKAPIAAATSTLKGPMRWSSDGYNNLVSYGDQNDRQMLQSMKQKLMASPQGHKLLIEASMIKPGTNSMRLDKILDQIKGMK